METNIRSQILSVLTQANSSDAYTDLTSNLDISPLVQILEAIETKDATKMQNALNTYSQCSNEHNVRKDQHERLGHLARQFQQSLISFRDSLGPTLANMGENSGDVQTQIESVIKMTNDSAMTVLSLAEKQSSTFKAFRNEAEGIGSLLNTDIINEKVKGSFTRLTEKMSEINTDLEESNKHLLLSQTYQDLTGQILQKIKFFIESVEDGLMEIVRMLTSDDIDQKLAEIDKERLQNNCSQNDVDDLLSSLGF